jgi:hypothetical protein
VIYEVYEDTHGRELETDSEVPLPTDLGKEFSDDELRRRFPRLWALKSQSAEGGLIGLASGDPAPRLILAR